MILCSIAVWPHVCWSVLVFNFLVSFFYILMFFFYNDGSLSPCNAHTCWSHFQPFHIIPSCRNYTPVVYTQIESLYSNKPKVRRAFLVFLDLLLFGAAPVSVEQLSFLFVLYWLTTGPEISWAIGFLIIWIINYIIMSTATQNIREKMLR